MTSLEVCILQNEFLEEERVSVNEKKLIMAYEELSEIPQNITDKYASWIEILDISHNRIRNPQCLVKFSKLTTLILDHNELTSDSRFPGLPNLHTLWINNNSILELGGFISRLARSAPNLRYLSMMKNPVTPCSFGDVSFTQYEMYRYFVIFYFSKLEHLDDESVSSEERKEAAKRFNNLKILQLLLPFTPKFPLDRENKIV